MDRIVQLAAIYMIRFGRSKSELLVIGGGPNKKLDSCSLSVQVDEQLITLSPHIRLLGAQLTFKKHV